jgi:hypothetical protein
MVVCTFLKRIYKIGVCNIIYFSDRPNFGLSINSGHASGAKKACMSIQLAKSRIKKSPSKEI